MPPSRFGDVTHAYVLDALGEVRGVAFAVSPRHFMTCVHVVAPVLGVEKTTAKCPLGQVRLKLFQSSAPDATATARVIAWHPLVAAGTTAERRQMADIAVLEVAARDLDRLARLDVEPRWTTLAREEDLRCDRDFLVWGPEQGGTAAEAKIKVLAPDDDGRLLATPHGQTRVVPGYSGAPALHLDPAQGAIVLGMITRANEHTGQLRIIPGTLLCAAFPDQVAGYHVSIRPIPAVTRAGTPHIFGGATMPLWNPSFTGREALLRATHAALSAEGGPVALPRVAVHGLGGVGKTSIARAYIQDYGAHYTGIWWIDARSRDRIRTGLGSLARVLNPSMPEETTMEEAAQVALRYIERAGTRFLLVYDDLPNPPELADLVPTHGARILITSLRQDWKGWAEEVEVREMTEAEDFLLERSTSSDEAGARRLAHILGRLPLALDHAGAYVRLGTSFDEYALRVKQRLAKVPSGAVYSRSVAATFDLAVEAAVKESPVAEKLLGLFAWLPQERIPLALVDEGVLPGCEREAGLGALSSVSLAKVHPAPGDAGWIAVHTLVRKVAQARIERRNTGELEQSQTASYNQLMKYYSKILKKHVAEQGISGIEYEFEDGDVSDYWKALVRPWMQDVDLDWSNIKESLAMSNQANEDFLNVIVRLVPV